MSEERITRYTTPEERENIAGIELDAADVENFMDLLRKGLVEAASQHDTTVQGNFALRAETSIRLGRAVRDSDGRVAEHVGREMTEGVIRARKVFKDPARAPKE